MRVGAAQPRSRMLDFHLAPADALAQVDETMEALEAIVHRAGALGCDALALPEDTLGLVRWAAGSPAARGDVLPTATARMLDRLGRAAAAHRMYLVCCTDTTEADGAVCNTAFFLGRDGKEIGRYHKVNLPIHEQDKRRGRGFPVFPTPDLGGVGMLICYDMTFPEAARCLALGGADVIFNPTLGGAAVADAEVNHAAFLTRAVENYVYIVVAKRGGGSLIISPHGKVLAEGDGPDDIAVADFDPCAGREGGDAVNHQADMRARLFRERSPEAYALLTDPDPPVLARVPASITVDEAVRLGREVPTIGEERFKDADALRAAGDTAAARSAFEQLRRDFPASWIDRVAQERLASL